MSIVIALIVFSFVVFIHELGHFLLAKKNKIVVEEFSIGMGPRLASTVKNGTRYSLKLFPIGGSCMMLGEDAEDMQEGSFNYCGIWGRISTIFAGPAFNFILAFILAFILLCMDGYNIPVVSVVDENGPAYTNGLQAGDQIIKYNGTKIKFHAELGLELYLNPVSASTVDVEVLRNGEKVKFEIEPKKSFVYRMGFDYNEGDSALIVDGVKKDSPIDKAGIKKGDQIVSFNGQEIATGRAFSDILANHPLDGNEVQVEYVRDGKRMSTTMTPQIFENYDMGFTYGSKKVKVHGIEAFTYSAAEVAYYVKSTFKSLALLVTGKLGANQLGGPVAVVSSIGTSVKASKSQGMTSVIISILSWGIMLSANLGVMNLIPFPALDGGRLVFLFYEVIFRKPANRKVEAIIHTVGFLLLMLLMVFVFYNDIARLIR